MTKPYTGPIDVYSIQSVHIDNGYSSVDDDPAPYALRRRRKPYIIRLGIGLAYLIGTLPVKLAIALVYLAAGFTLLGLVIDLFIHLVLFLAPDRSPARLAFQNGWGLFFELTVLWIVLIAVAVMLANLQAALKRFAANLQG
jgi:hypothetical protein